MEKYIISGGSVVRAQGVVRADVAITNGKVSEIGENLPTHGAKVVDASECYVMPGGVDARTRISHRFAASAGEKDSLSEPQCQELWHTATLAAAYGGTTCIVEVPAQGQAKNPTKELLHMAKGHSAVDFSVYSLAAADGSLPKDDGSPALCPMTGEGALDDAAMLRALHALAQAGGLARVRCANDAMLAWCADRLRTQGNTGVQAIAQAYPVLNEEEGVWRLMALAQTAGTAVSVANVSTASAAFMLRMSRAHGHKMFAETCPHYLTLDASCYEEGVAEGLKYYTLPPLRAKSDQTGLWQSLRDGGLDIVSSDHYSGDYSSRWETSQGNIFTCPWGLPGVETRVPLLFCEGVLKGRLTLPRFVEVMATRPADMLGLPYKGRIEVGADADIMVLNPAEERSISAGMLHQGVDYTPYEGMKVRGWAQHVWLRGHRLIENYAFTGKENGGQRVSHASAGV